MVQYGLKFSVNQLILPAVINLAKNHCMKRALLATIFSLFTILAFSQSSPDGSDDFLYPQETLAEQPTISIYPNPATNYISVDNDENVNSIIIFNLVGRKIMTFENIQKNEQYDVTTLSNGMYLVQVTDSNNKIITTQRISKR